MDLVKIGTFLQALRKESKIPVKVFSLDLTDPASFERLQALYKKEKPEIRLLINASGYGKFDAVEDTDMETELNMIDLNCRAAVDITLSCLPYMQAGDRIIQICSTAAFQPLQHVNIYSATKAFLYHYTRALRMELLPRKISVLAVCPYWVKDTEFIGIAEKGKVAAAGRKDMPIRHYTFATTADRVVRSALRCSRMGLAVCTPGAVCTLDRIFAKILPREAMLYIWEAFRRI